MRLAITLALFTACHSDVYRPASPAAVCKNCSKQVVAPGSQLEVAMTWSGFCLGKEWESLKSDGERRDVFTCDEHSFTAQVDCGGCVWKVDYFGPHHWAMAFVTVPEQHGPFSFVVTMKSGSQERSWRTPELFVDMPSELAH
jgi:hypothetical protein